MGRGVRFGVLGCASIAEKLVRAMLLIPGVEISALGSRSLTKAQEFAAKNNLLTDCILYGSYEEVLDDTNVDCVYIPLPTGLHLEWVVKAAEKKKHVLLEKPVAHSVDEMETFLAAIERRNLQFMDGTMFMHHPRTKEMKQVLHNSEIIGELLEVSATYTLNTEVILGPTWAQTNIRGQPHLDGLGALGDLGWYCTRVILWAFDFDMPSAVTAHPGTRFAESGVITSCGATYQWKDGRIATFRCSFYGDMIMKAVCSGSKGSLEVDDFVIPMKEDHAMFSAKRGSKFGDRSTGWTSHKKTNEVKTEQTQEALMVEQFARLVGQIIDGSGKPDPFWPAISKKTQILLNAVKSSTERNSATITL